MKLEALRSLAVENGVTDARELGRAELIERLAHKKPSLVERAREVVAHAVERVEEKAHELADRVRHRHDRDQPHDEAAHEGERHEGRRARSESMGVPSSIVHPQMQARGDTGEPLTMLDFEELPETYGVDECEVVARDPATVFAYWEVTDTGLDGARAQLGQSASTARLVLRLFTTVPVNGHVEREIKDVDLPWNHGRKYLQAPRSGAHLRIAVGLLSTEGYFAPIAHSSLVRVPPTGPQPGNVEWMEVVPARRGRGREPLVIVRRGEHDERSLTGVPGAYTGGEWEEPVGASKGRWKPGDRGPGPNPTGSSSGGLK